MEFEVIKLLHIKQAITNSYSGKRYMIDKHFSCSFAETFSLVHFDNTVTGQRCYLRKILGNCNRVDVCIKITNGLCYSAGARKQFSMYSMELPNLVPTHFLRKKPQGRGWEQPIAQQQSLNCTSYTAINGYSYGAYLALEVIRLRENFPPSTYIRRLTITAL